MVEIGTRAPDFELPDQGGRPVRLRDLVGKTGRTVSTPRQTPRAARRRPAASGTALPSTTPPAPSSSASPDPVAAVKRFHGKQSLNFTLLADTDHAVCDRYGVWVEKSMYGRRYWRAARLTFIIDGEGHRRARDPEGVAEDPRRGARGVGGLR